MNYEIKYTKRRCVAIRIKQGEVIVFAPISYENSQNNQEKLRKFLESKREWISRKIAEYNASLKYFGLDEVLKYKKFLLFGEKMRVLATTKKSLKITANGEILIPKEIDIETLKKKLKREYARIAQEQLANRLFELAGKHGFYHNSFKLTNAGGKWGSCDDKKNIRLNWRLILLPTHVADYVVIHELCHTVELNHSNRFWNFVARVLPNYKQLNKDLKNYGALTSYLR